MTTIHANIPDDLAQAASAAAERERTTFDRIVASSLAAQLGAGGIHEDIEERAKRGKPSFVREVLDAVPDARPLPGDEL